MLSTRAASADSSDTKDAGAANIPNKRAILSRRKLAEDLEKLVAEDRKSVV